jgi:hypothetical protein
MTKMIFKINEHSDWQLVREARIVDRKERIKQKYLGDPRANFRQPSTLEPSTRLERREALPILYEFMDEVDYAEAEVYLMQIQEDEVTF